MGMERGKCGWNLGKKGGSNNTQSKVCKAGELRNGEFLEVLSGGLRGKCLIISISHWYSYWKKGEDGEKGDLGREGNSKPEKKSWHGARHLKYGPGSLKDMCQGGKCAGSKKGSQEGGSQKKGRHLRKTQAFQNRKYL